MHLPVDLPITNIFAPDYLVVLVGALLHVTGQNVCTIRGDGMVVDCTNVKLSAIPADLLSGLTLDLLLEKNKFSSIPTDQLSAAPNLRFLDLTSNLLTVISEDSFRTTPNLKELVIDGNILLREVHPNAFSHFRNLSRLHLSGAIMTAISPSHFVPLASLEELRFGFAPISHAEIDLFAPLHNIVRVDVAVCGAVSVALATHSLGLTTLSRLEYLYVCSACFEGQRGWGGAAVRTGQGGSRRCGYNVCSSFHIMSTSIRNLVCN